MFFKNLMIKRLNLLLMPIVFCYVLNLNCAGYCADRRAVSDNDAILSQKRHTALQSTDNTQLSILQNTADREASPKMPNSRRVAENPPYPGIQKIQQSTKFSLYENPFKFSSYYRDSESGLDYCKARYYSSQTDTFISRDTYDLPNRYAYCGGDPLGSIDPEGHLAIGDIFSNLISPFTNPQFNAQTVGTYYVGATLLGCCARSLIMRWISKCRLPLSKVISVYCKSNPKKVIGKGTFAVICEGTINGNRSVFKVMKDKKGFARKIFNRTKESVADRTKRVIKEVNPGFTVSVFDDVIGMDFLEGVGSVTEEQILDFLEEAKTRTDRLMWDPRPENFSKNGQICFDVDLFLKREPDEGTYSSCMIKGIMKSPGGLQGYFERNVLPTFKARPDLLERVYKLYEIPLPANLVPEGSGL